ncbi:hypothetical protein ACN20G_23510 [Streptomyces sp. BI20]|uniref:hypothetical protein n=1 Tax=Streptomyces sp. BI20 TaxID=3403460 RepID=UPI003C70D0CE
MAEAPTFRLDISPNPVSPGQDVTLTAHGATGPVTVNSGVFPTVTLTSPTYTATAKVDADARPGAKYSVSYTEGSGTLATELVISGTPAGTGTDTRVTARKIAGDIFRFFKQCADATAAR